MAEIGAKEQLFGDLPDALVKELLSQTLPVAGALQQHIEQMREQRNALREHALQKGVVKRKADLDAAREPSVVGIDGSYQIHRLTAFDLCAAAAVAVEGTVNEALRRWPEPHHRIWVGGVPHQGQPASVLKGLMTSMELELAAEAPHDLILLDGSFASLIIAINQGVSQLTQADRSLAEPLKTRWNSGLHHQILQLLESDRAVAVPKFTSRNELVSHLELSTSWNADGKTLATLILEPGEYTQPLDISAPPSPYHLPEPADNNKLNQAMKNLRVIYFRPYGWTAAVRLEVPNRTAKSNTRLAIVLEGIQRQVFSPAVREPYPLFLADQMVGSLAAGIKVAEQTIAQQIVSKSVDVETTLLFLQNYRTESGRGDVE